MENFTPWSSLLGGAIIGFASLIMLYQNRICGISGIYRNALYGKSLWRLLFIAGLLAGGFLSHYFLPESFLIQFDSSLTGTIAGGALVGLGTSIGGGCTSGHGVCGMGRFSVRSIVASLTFLFFAVLTASLIRWEA